MKTCPYCNHENEDYEKFCVFCARPIQDIHMEEKDKEWRNDIKKA